MGIPKFGRRMRDKSLVLPPGEKYDPEQAARELSRNSKPAEKLLRRLFKRSSDKKEGKVTHDTILGVYSCAR